MFQLYGARASPTSTSTRASAPACATCHPPFPHPEGWVSGHLGVVADGGPSICLGCHEAGDGASTMPAACGLPCHGEAP